MKIEGLGFSGLEPQILYSFIIHVDGYVKEGDCGSLTASNTFKKGLLYDVGIDVAKTNMIAVFWDPMRVPASQALTTKPVTASFIRIFYDKAKINVGLGATGHYSSNLLGSA